MNPPRQRALESFGNGPVALSLALKRFPKRMWSHKISRACPSIHEIICELADREVIDYIDARRFVAEHDSPAIDIDSAAWCARLSYSENGVQEAIEAIRIVRRASYHFLALLSDSAWSYTGEIPVYGRVTLDAWLEIRNNYFSAKIEHMRRIHSEWAELPSVENLKSKSKCRIVCSVRVGELY
jgi:hypothetical protein